MFCCPNCFTHTFLKEFIVNSSKQHGKCSYCNSRGVKPILNPTLLIDLFQPLLDLYIEDKKGKSLVISLQDDWNVFSSNINDPKKLQLLRKISGIKGLSSKRYISSLVSDNDFKQLWEEFADELKYENRFFPQKLIDPSELVELFDYLIMPQEQKPEYIFRARINHNSSNMSISEMGKPPEDESTDGRANPKGISYFYGASDEKTAIAETRPSKTEKVCVAKYKVKSKISLIDLRDPKSSISPFGLDDDNLTLLYKNHMPVLEHLGKVLSKPVLPHKKELEYLPTQYLCELIKNSKFNGIAFKSSLEKGDNYVIFNDSFLSGNKKVECYLVTDTKVESNKL